MTEQRAHNGFTLPAIGLGTYGLRGSDGAAAAGEAIRSGYRLLDSAFSYGNEATIGRAVRESGELRDSVVFTSKLQGRHQARDLALGAIEESLYRSSLDAIDLYLIHWPNPRVGLYVEAWQALIEAQRQGLVKQIGVSNFLPEHLERLEAETGVRPVVNQIELHPDFPQEEAVAYHRERGIITEAWSPLGKAGEMLEQPAIQRIAADHGVSPVQAVLAWHVARGVVPIPKSGNPERQRQNLAAADIALSADEVAEITALGRPDGRLAAMDPATHEEL